MKRKMTVLMACLFWMAAAAPVAAQEENKQSNIDWTEDTTEVKTIKDIIEEQQRVTLLNAADRHYSEVWGRRSYMNFGFSMSKLSPTHDYQTGIGSKVPTYKSNWGASFQYGRSYRLHKKSALAKADANQLFMVKYAIDGQLSAGVNVDVYIEIGGSQTVSGLSIPAHAIFEDGGKTYVWVVEQGDVVKLYAQWKAIPKYTISYDLDGGTLDKKNGTVTYKYEKGTVIKLPKPEKKGYIFSYWEGSKYAAGAKYSVKADHTFKAVWKAEKGSAGNKSGTSSTNAGSSNNSNGARNRSANTGDDSNQTVPVLLLIISAAIMAIIRTASGPPAPPSAFAAQPTAASEKSTIGGACSA